MGKAPRQFNKPPFVKWNVVDYFSCPKVQGMRAEQRGWYTNMLFNSWNSLETCCMIPNDVDSIHEFAGIDKEDAAEVGRFTEKGWRVLRCFETTADAKFLYNKRLLREYDLLLGHRKAQAVAIKNGIRAKQKKARRLRDNSRVTPSVPQVTLELQKEVEVEKETREVKAKPCARKTGGPAKPLDSIPVRLPPDERFKLCVDAVDKYWQFKNNSLPFIWDESEGKELKRLLQATPRLTLEQFKTCLNHRARSEVVHTDRPRLWLKNVMSFAAAPIDRYGKPLGENGNGKQQVSAAQARQQRTRSAIANAFGVGHREDAGSDQFDNPPGSDRAGGIVLEGDLGGAPPGDD